jgi:two-component system sensor histidine kinase HydH
MRFPRLGSLRLRLTIAFLLVSIPSMLAAALIAAQLLSSAFDSNLQQWLEEASHYFLGDIAENEAENARIAALVGRNITRLGRLPQNLDDLGGMEFYQATGKDFVAIISSNGAVLFGPEIQGFPASAKKAADGSLVMMRKDCQSRLAIGGQYQMPWQGQVITIIVGSSLYDTINNAGKSMKALHFSLWQMEQGVLVNANRAEAGGSQNAQTALVQLKPPAAIVAELNRGAAPIIDDPGDEGPYYYTAYSPLKSASGDLIGVLSIGVSKDEDIFEQIPQWRLFSGIFIAGAILAILAGLVMSGFLVKPLRDITRGVRAIGRGDFRQSVPEKGGAELEELAATINGMAGDLERLRSMEGQLRHREKLTALGEAAALIAHEIRNPLGIIKTSTDLVRRRAVLKPEEERMLDYIADEVRRIDDLVRSFLDFARFAPPHRRPMLLEDLLRRIMQGMAPEAERLKINMTIAIGEGSFPISGDADQIHQAVLNLLLNAFDALPDGGEIVLGLERRDGLIIVSVSDNGPGLPPDLVERAFDPFVTGKARGSGLGLAKVASVMEGHGGQALYRAREPRGACFEMIFPELVS